MPHPRNIIKHIRPCVDHWPDRVQQIGNRETNTQEQQAACLMTAPCPCCLSHHCAMGMRSHVHVYATCPITAPCPCCAGAGRCRMCPCSLLRLHPSDCGAAWCSAASLPCASRHDAMMVVGRWARIQAGMMYTLLKNEPLNRADPIRFLTSGWCAAR